MIDKEKIEEELTEEELEDLDNTALSEQSYEYN